MGQAAPQRLEVARHQAVDDVEAGDALWRGDIGRDPARDRQQSQVVGENELKQDTDPEPGHGHTRHSKDPRGVILPAVLADGGNDAQGDTHQHS